MLVAEEFLHLADVHTGLKKMRGKAVAEGMDRGMLCYASLSQGILDSLLDGIVTDMVSAYPAAPWVDR